MQKNEKNRNKMKKNSGKIEKELTKEGQNNVTMSIYLLDKL